MRVPELILGGKRTEDYMSSSENQGMGTYSNAIRYLLDARSGHQELLHAFFADRTPHGADLALAALISHVRAGKMSPEALLASLGIVFKYASDEEATKLLCEAYTRLLTEPAKESDFKRALAWPLAIVRRLFEAHGSRHQEQCFLNIVDGLVLEGFPSASPLLSYLAEFGAVDASDGPYALQNALQDSYRRAAKIAEMVGKYGVAAGLLTTIGEDRAVILPLYKLAFKNGQAVDLTRARRSWQMPDGLSPVSPVSGVSSRRSEEDLCCELFVAFPGNENPSRMRRDRSFGTTVFVGDEIEMRGDTVTETLVKMLASGRWGDVDRLLSSLRVQAYYSGRFPTLVDGDLIIPAMFLAKKRGDVAIAAALGQVVSGALSGDENWKRSGPINSQLLHIVARRCADSANIADRAERPQYESEVVNYVLRTIDELFQEVIAKNVLLHLDVD